MKIKNIDIINYKNVLEYFGDKKLPQKISYAITRNMLIISKELEPYRVSLQKIIDAYQDYQIKNSNGEIENMSIGIPKVDKEHETNYLSEVNDLINIETNIELYYIDEDVFDYQDFERYDAMSAQDIITLQSVLCKMNDKPTE